MPLSKVHQKRLEQVQSVMTPRQFVLQDVLKAAKHPSFAEYAAAVGEGRVLCGDTLMDRIARSVTARTKFSSRRDEQAAIRRAQQEGLFLGKLVCFCSSAVLESTGVWRLHAACGATMVLLIARADDLADREFERVAVSAGHLFAEFHVSVIAHHRAAALVSKTYFDGTDVLHPSARQAIDHCLAHFEGALKPLSLIAFEGGVPEPADHAVRLAREWVQLARAMTHDAFGETATGVRMLCRLIRNG